MTPFLRRWIIFGILAACTSLLLLNLPRHSQSPIEALTHPGFLHAKFRWKDLPQRHSVEHFTQLPTGPFASIPKIQFEFPPETDARRVTRQTRLNAVKEAFLHSWQGYTEHAWLQDEVGPISGLGSNGYAGWGATLVDTLDTLWIMGLQEEFEQAVAALGKIDFTTTPLTLLNVFETTIRYLGGLLSAYDISDHQYPVLLTKAAEIGEMLYVAFDTPNRMPVTRWDWRNSALGLSQEADAHSLLAEVGSLTLEFTRLSQLTGNPKWYDAVARITDELQAQQNLTRVPGLWPTMLDTQHGDFTKDFTFTLGGMADSVYEYLPKQHLLLAGRSSQYRSMYANALASAKKNLFFRPFNTANQDLLIPGTVKHISALHAKLIPEAQHLTCFAGGMVALAAKTFNQPEEMETARQLVRGCLWAYESTSSAIMPEVFHAIPCAVSEGENCTFTDHRWYEGVTSHAGRGHASRNKMAEHAQKLIRESNLSPGWTAVDDARYQLRPEAIESLFVLYRITGEDVWQEAAWDMFLAVTKATKTRIAYAGIKDVRAESEDVRLEDSMESFWTAETLKYFYLVFSESNVVSLDDYVL